VTLAEFRVDVTPESALAFAELSGDWNPLHTNPAHAAGTSFRVPVLHGAFSAGLFSRMAGMHLPGTDCLLHSLQLRFVAPILPPATLVVRGVVEADNGEVGRVAVTVSDATTGTRYVEGRYGFGRHEHGVGVRPRAASAPLPPSGKSAVLVTGASGAVGRALMSRLGEEAVALPRSHDTDGAPESDAALLERVAILLNGRPLRAIAHCGWPSPDNGGLLSLTDTTASVEHHVAAPLRQVLALAKVLERFGREQAMLLLLGSTAAEPGRHNYRMPLYTLSKSLVPTLTRALAVELGATKRRVAAVVLDVIDGGMNERMSRSARVAHSSRAPSGTLPTPDDVAGQMQWMMHNDSALASGAVISLTGGAIP